MEFNERAEDAIIIRPFSKLLFVAAGFKLKQFLHND